ncbi:hypothetical protein Skr01_36440 [Sphaerisporangium krabiense]|uniref:Transposase-like protein n=1 Tax=Sphaerisporangium krabiense TaxID=763782 RepID=A0A7W8Z372_9ACTN|nr:hypothetical protein [Sphaerisporangium krabiense]MBB5626637.1 transposase-like protein [Sphaerisporangium krabiense]GII63559.1 hypothetical protein Skr01_36440 [Sphaerisporangium krabiense]
MPPPLDPVLRAAILETIRAGGKSCRGIARQHGVSDATVRKIASDNGIRDAFSRAQTESATRARVADMRARRAELSEQLLDDVQRLRERAWSAYQVVTNGRDGAEVVDLALPPLRDVQAAYTSLGIAVDKHAQLVKLDTDNGAAQARSMLGALAAALDVAANALDEPPPADAS